MIAKEKDAVCLILGFSAAPSPLLPVSYLRTGSQIYGVVPLRVCSSHHVTSPCECGEPLNSVAKDLEPAFDPLGIKDTGRSVYFASIVRSLALAESVSRDSFV